MGIGTAALYVVTEELGRRDDARAELPSAICWTLEPHCRHGCILIDIATHITRGFAPWST